MATNIVKDYPWTAIPAGSQLRDEAPSAFVRAYQLNQAALSQFASGYVNLAVGAAGGQSGDDFYKNLYDASEKEVFHFPYFNDNFRSFGTNFANTFSNVSERGGSFKGADFIQGGAGEIADVAMAASEAYNLYQNQVNGSPPAGSYIETPKFYQYENTDESLQISFVLSNTINEGDAEKNLKFITDFTKLNKPERKSAVSLSFPAIYKVEVEGLRFIEWAYCENLSFELLGTRRKVNGKTIPEAFRCSMSFKSLTLEPSNFIK